MLGYITVDRGELKEKDLQQYRAFYCGVCQDLKYHHGQIARFTHNFDMTFLAILLTSLSYGKTVPERHFCVFRPEYDKTCFRNEFTAYAADMCVLLVYHNLMDDWMDDQSQKSVLMAGLIRREYRKTAANYRRQANAALEYVRKLHRLECSGNTDIDLASGLTGHFLEEIFVYDPDGIWNTELRAIGFFLGKFIYLMDAYEDLKEDEAAGRYNPFLPMAGDSDFEKKAAEILTMMAASATRAFERLPVVAHVDILRNILYCGIWSAYHRIRAKR